MAKILLIEDDNDVRTMLKLTLTHCGHTVIEAKNGREGIALFNQAGADLVITDIVMPEKEGLEVLMEVRKKNPGVKIVAISGGGRSSATDYLKMAKLMGANRVLPKPFSNDALLAVVNELVGKNR